MSLIFDRRQRRYLSSFRVIQRHGVGTDATLASQEK